MAHSTTSVFSNAVQGIPGVGVDFDIFASDSAPVYPVGTRFTRSDGNEYTYSHFGTACTDGGMIVGCDQSESGTSRVGARIYASGSVTAIAGESIKPNTAGSYYVQIIGGGITADKFAGGYFQVTQTGKKGHMLTYRIKGNTASAQLTSGAKLTYYIELYEPLLKTIGAAQTGTVRIFGSQYSNLESVKAGASAMTDPCVAGITTCSHAASTWGWVQTDGIAGVRTDNVAINRGSAISVSANANGCCSASCQRHIGQSRQIIGYCVDSGAGSGVNLLVAKLQL